MNVDKSLNFPTGWLVKITVNADGENVETLSGQSVSGTIRADGTALGDAALASDVEILDTTAEGLAGTVSPSRLSGVTLSASDVRYYTVDENGAIDRLILNDATGDLWTYGVLDDVTNLISTAASSTTNGPLIPQRRRSGAGGHPAVGHEQRGGGRSDWRGSRQRVLWRGADFFPQPDRGKRRGCAPKRADCLLYTSPSPRDS